MLKIYLNDSLWSSNMVRAEALRDVAIAQLGSLDIDMGVFTLRIYEGAKAKILPVVRCHTSYYPHISEIFLDVGSYMYTLEGDKELTVAAEVLCDALIACGTEGGKYLLEERSNGSERSNGTCAVESSGD